MAVTIVMMMSMSTSVFAENDSSDDYSVTYSANEITDSNDLIDLAIQQSATSLRANASEKMIDQLEVTQLLEERTYQNGENENLYVTSIISLSDEELLLRNLGDIEFLPSASDNHVANFSVVFRFYYTCRVAPAGNLVYRVNSIVTQIIKSNVTAVNIIDATQMYKLTACCDTIDG